MQLRATCLAVVLAGAAASAADAQTTIRFSNWLPPTHPISTDIIEPWAANVEQATEGRVVVQILPALGKPPAHFDLVRDGIADAAMSVHAYTADRFPTAYGMTLPGYADDATSASVAYWRTYKEHFEKANEFDGVKLIGLWTHGPGHFFTRNKAITSAEDLEGLRLRATGGIVQDISSRLGIVPQFAPASEAYELLSRGVVDGVMFNSDSVYSFKLNDILTNALRVPGGLYRDTHYVIMNQNTWESLSAEDQQAIESVSGEALARLAGQAWDKVEGEAWDGMAESGYTITVADDALIDRLAQEGEGLKVDWIARVEPLGIDGEAALETFRTEIENVQAE